MLSDPFPEFGIIAPDPDGRGGASIHLHVDDADAVIARAIEAGARPVRPAADQFYGERSGAVRDPFGHEWLIGHAIETVTPEEMQRRYDTMAEASDMSAPDTLPRAPSDQPGKDTRTPAKGWLQGLA